MDRSIIEANIERHTELLARNLSGMEKAKVERLLAEERAKLADLLGGSPTAAGGTATDSVGEQSR